MQVNNRPWPKANINDRTIALSFENLSDAVSDAEYSELCANAQLIETAPQMLDCLKMIYSLANLQALLETKYSRALCNDIMKQMQLAIDKAEGF